MKYEIRLLEFIVKIRMKIYITIFNDTIIGGKDDYHNKLELPQLYERTRDNYILGNYT